MNLKLVTIPKLALNENYFLCEIRILSFLQNNKVRNVIIPTVDD